MVNDIVCIIVKDMVMGTSISSIIISSNCLSLSPGVPGDSVGDILGTSPRNSEVAVGDSHDALGTSLRDTEDRAGDTCQCKTGTAGC